MLFIVVSLLIVLQTNQGTTTPSENAGGKQECQLSGQVVTQEGGHPLKNTLVALEQISGNYAKKKLSQRTGEDGKFCFTTIAAGQYSVSAGHIGYVWQWYGEEDAWSDPTFLTVEAGQKFEPILFRLIPGAVITGRIVNEDGDPLPGVLVKALFAPELAESIFGKSGNNKSGSIPVQTAMTNDLGEYRLAGLPPGKYLVNASFSGAMKSSAGSSLIGAWTTMMQEEEDATGIYVPSYYPGTPNLAEAAPIEVKAGDETTASLQLFHERTVTVSGVVLNEDGTPSPEAIFEFKAVGSSSLNSFIHVEKDGHFTIKHVLPGSYIAEAESTTHLELTKVEKVRQIVEVEQQDVNLRLLLKGGVTLSGTLRLEGGTVPELSKVRLYFHGAEGDQGLGLVANDGRLEVPSLMPGTYRVSVSGLPDHY